MIDHGAKRNATDYEPAGSIGWVVAGSQSIGQAN